MMEKFNKFSGDVRVDKNVACLSSLMYEKYVGRNPKGRGFDSHRG
jgi:hypothetical protein